MGLDVEDDWLGPRVDLDPVDRLRAREAIVRRMFGGDPSPICVGRYEVVRAIGVGAMGRVYLARDPALDRSVALKFVLLPEDSGRRVEREARVLARLSHPHVVDVYDAGTFMDRRFLAMEYVEGLSLREWLDTTKPTFNAVVDAFGQAARGLAAAHDVGVIHRDIKPDNLLCGKDGRVRIADFGLASVSPSGRAGTPAYFAPELELGATASARSDQYAFFVTLHEALCGHRPVQRPTSRARPRGQPARLWSILSRGLHVDPQRRFASMHDVAAALQASASVRMRWGLASVAAVAGVLALAWPPAADCASQGRAHIAEVWDGTDGDAFERRFVAYGGVDAGPAGRFVREQLDRHAARWAEVNDRACQATPAERETIEGCLEERRAQLAAVIEQLDAATPPQLRAAPNTMAGVMSATECLGTTRSAPLGRELARVVARSQALAHAGRHHRAVATLAAVDESLLPRSAVAVVAYERGRALVGTGEFEAATQQLQSALWAASSVADDVQAARAALELVQVRGYELSDFEGAQQWTRQADAIIVRLGSPPRLLADFEMVQGAVEYAAGRYPRAKAHYLAASRAFASVEATAVDLSDLNGKLATVSLELGEHAEALRYLDEATQRRLQMFGAVHPMVAETHVNRGAIFNAMGRPDDAITEYQRSADVFSKTLGRDHAVLVAVEQNIGNLDADAGRYDQAMVHYRRALAVGRAALGDAHPQVATVLDNAGGALRHLGETSLARAWLDEALRIRTQVLGPGHLDLAYSHGNLGNLELDAGNVEAAVAHFTQARDRFARALGADHAATRATQANLDRATAQRP